MGATRTRTDFADYTEERSNTDFTDYAELGTTPISQVTQIFLGRPKEERFSPGVPQGPAQISQITQKKGPTQISRIAQTVDKVDFAELATTQVTSLSCTDRKERRFCKLQRRSHGLRRTNDSADFAGYAESLVRPKEKFCVIREICVGAFVCEIRVISVGLL
jgi:hypothetical protein